MTKYYRNIKNLRVINKRTQVEIAKVLGIAQNTYSQYENGKIPYRADMLIVLADLYGVDIDFLLDRTF